MQKIKSLTQTRVNYKMADAANPENSEWVEDTSYRTLLNEYNNEGKLSKAATFDPEGDMVELYKYTYNEAGLVSEEVLFYDEDEEAEHRWFNYDEQGILVSEKITYQEGSEAHITFKWDDKKRLLEKVIMDDEGEIEQKEVYEYAGENMTREAVYEEGNVLATENLYTYDEEGRLVETVSVHVKDKMKTRIVLRYNEKGARSQMLKYNTKNQLIEKATYTEDENEHVVEITEEDAAGIKHTRSTYDEKGNTILQEELSDNEELNHRIERTYNEHGDMAESTIYIDNHGNSANQFYTIRYDYEYVTE